MPVATKLVMIFHQRSVYVVGCVKESLVVVPRQHFFFKNRFNQLIKRTGTASREGLSEGVPDMGCPCICTQ